MTALDITDVTGQISARSGRIYRHDAEVFARFLLDQGLTMNTLHLLTRSHMIAYRKYLGDVYAKATAGGTLRSSSTREIARQTMVVSSDAKTWIP